MEQIKFNGCYTLESPQGDYRTFKISTAKYGGLKGRRILSILAGPDNTSNYRGFAFVEDNEFKLWRRAQCDKKLATYARCLLSMILEDKESMYYKKGMRVFLESRCRVCNRKLTTPDSIISGIGPICEGRLVGNNL